MALTEVAGGVEILQLLSGEGLEQSASRVAEIAPDFARMAIEFPFGEPAYEIFAVFYAGDHRRKLVNGYSGFFPRSYAGRVAALHDVTTNPQRAADVLRASGATHALVHEGAFTGDKGREVSEWLKTLGAREVTSHRTDRLFEIR